MQQAHIPASTAMTRETGRGRCDPRHLRRRATGRRRVFGGNGDGRHVRRPRAHW